MGGSDGKETKQLFSVLGEIVPYKKFKKRGGRTIFYMCFEGGRTIFYMYFKGGRTIFYMYFRGGREDF